MVTADLPVQEIAPDPTPVVAAPVSKLPRDISKVPNKSLEALLERDDFGAPDSDTEPKVIKKPEEPKKAPAKKAAKPVVPPEEPDEEEVEDPADADDTDFDSPVEDAPPPDEDEVPQDESLARQRAKENGRDLKRTKAELTLAQTELEKLRERVTTAEAAAKELKATKVSPKDDPEYRKMFSDVRSSVESEAELIPGADGVWENFSGFLGSYVDAKALTGPARKDAIGKLKLDIIAKCGGYELGYEDLDPDEKAAADTMATAVLKVVMGNTPKAEAVMELHDKLSADADLGIVAVREREYKEAVGRIQPDLDALGDIDPETIAKNPHSIEAMIASTIADSPAAKNLSEKAKEEIRDVIAGLQPLSRKEIDKLKANGTNLKEFEAAREKAHSKKVQKFIRLAFKGAMAATTFGKKLEEWAILKGDADAEESEETVLRKVVTKAKPKQDAAPTRPSERKNYGLNRFLDD
jgi:hypothetical protein